MQLNLDYSNTKYVPIPNLKDTVSNNVHTNNYSKYENDKKKSQNSDYQYVGDDFFESFLALLGAISIFLTGMLLVFFLTLPQFAYYRTPKVIVPKIEERFNIQIPYRTELKKLYDKFYVEGN